MKSPSCPRRSAALTRIEVLAVLASLSLIAVLTRPTWGNPVPTRSLVCMDNLRRLSAAWLMYATENRGRFPGNYHGTAIPQETERPWVTGWLDWATGTDNTNTIYLTDDRYCALAFYLDRDVTLFKCPSDNYVSPVQAARGWAARVRSYSMNCYVGEGNQSTGPFDARFPIHRKMSDFGRQSPQQTFVFTEEHPDSINDGLLFVAMSQAAWTDLPGSFHDSSCWFTFADGHLELRRWAYPRTVLPVGFGMRNNVSTLANDPDLLWVRQHTTEPLTP